MQPLSIGPRNWVCGLIRLTGRTRSAPAAWTSRCSGRPRMSWATTTVSIDERISQSRASGVIPSLASVASWPSAVAPPWLPIAGTTNGAAPRSRSPAMAPRSSSTRAGQAATAGADGHRHPVVDRAGEGPHDLVARRALDVGDGRRVGHRQLDAGQRGTVIDGSIGSTTPAWSWSHPTMPTVRGSLGAVEAGDRFVGEIAGAGTTSGTRLVVGHWPTSPFGPIADAMVEHADGRRVLIAPTPGGRRLHRRRVRVRRRRRHRRRRPANRGGCASTAGRWTSSWRSVGATPSAGCCARCPGPIATSPTWATIVDPVARTVLRGVRTRGTTPGGDEFYGATDRHRIVAAVTSVGRRRPRAARRRRPAGALRVQLRPAAAVDRGGDDDGAASAAVTARSSAWRAMLRCMPPKTIPWNGYTDHQ